MSEVRTELDPRFSDPDPEPTSWRDAVETRVCPTRVDHHCSLRWTTPRHPARRDLA
jgi:hypothetical protein